MAKLADIAAMKQRVAATEAKLITSAQEGRKRNVRLLGLLDAVEKTVAHKQRQVRRLAEEQGRALEEVKQLRTLLGVMLSEVQKARKKKRLGKVLTVLGFLSCLATAALVADKVHSDIMNDALKGALLRSQVTRHELSQELARVSADLHAIRKRRDRYRGPETLSAAGP